MIRHRADDQQHVRVARRGRDEKSQPVHVVIGIVELLHFVEARAAIARVHDADVNGAMERLAEFMLTVTHTSPLIALLPINRMLHAANTAVAMNAAAILHNDPAVAFAEYPRRAARNQRINFVCGIITAIGNPGETPAAVSGLAGYAVVLIPVRMPVNDPLAHII